MDFRMTSQQIVDKENHGVPANVENKEPQRVVSILKSSQKINCPSEKKLTKVSSFETSSVICLIYVVFSSKSTKR